MSLGCGWFYTYMYAPLIMLGMEDPHQAHSKPAVCSVCFCFALLGKAWKQHDCMLTHSPSPLSAFTAKEALCLVHSLGIITSVCTPALSQTCIKVLMIGNHNG
ncbi:unnamed protein product [Orchesella dallaii]|uniref:Uncharacterized protein n=1 Tax=Orchesella dallaii TaxID=48710 RepID=A0ABP1Q8K0_9HEXA